MKNKSSMSLKRIKIIDIHAHIYSHIDTKLPYPWMGTSDPKVLIRSAKRAGITKSVVSHSYALHTDSFKTQEKVNMELLKYCERYPELLMWLVVDPRNSKSLAVARRFSGHERLVGFKIHPRLHKYYFAHFEQEIFGLARETNLPVLTHSGNSTSMPLAMVKCANNNPDVRLIIAHYGNCVSGTGHLDALKQCTSENVFVDTSSAHSIEYGIIEHGVRQVGAKRFLFGTDHAAYDPSAQCYRIMNADLSLKERTMILGQNAIKHILRKEQI